jgi:hypothetical protein
MFLSLRQWRLPQIAPVQPENIESDEVLRRRASNERVEERLACGVQVNDLSPSRIAF